jgi:regulator of sigma E protease
MFTPLTIFFGIVALGLLIFVHETGHFLVAKAFGVRVITYSFGFGHRLFGFRHAGTDYRVSAIPFGGYVRMWGADPFEVEEHEEQLEAERSVSTADIPHRPPRRGEWALQDVAVWKRLLIYAAGPAANLVVPFFVFVVLFMSGEPQVASVVGTVMGDSPAAVAGLQPGDLVVEVEGHPVRTWEELDARWLEVTDVERPVALVVERGERRLSLELPPLGAGLGSGSPDDFGLLPTVASAHVGVLHSLSPAGRAGITTGDLIVSVGGVEVETWPELSRALAGAGERVEVSWIHGDQTLRAVLERDEAWIPAAVRAVLDVPADLWGVQTATLSVGGFSDDSTAKAAGLLQGATLLAIDGTRVRSWNEVLRGVALTLRENGEERVASQVSITVLQDDAAFELSVLPQVQRVTDARGRYYWRPRIGVASLGGWAASPKVRIYYSLPQAVSRAARDSVLLVRFTLEQLTMLATGEASMKDSLGGPVEIVRQTTQAARAGWMHFSRLLGMISISVGIFNLLPVPVLDGGHLLFYSLEAVRGRPVSPLFRERAQIVGVMLLVAVMIFVLVNDIGRLDIASWFGGAG